MAKSNNKVIDDSIILARQLLRRDVLAAMDILGMEAIKYAITNHEFNNRTNNLEDSYGYAVYYNGSQINKVITDKKATVLKGGKSGNEEANTFLDNYNAGDGYTLVVVAGMYYAAYVEFEYGLDVLTGSYQETMNNIGKSFRKMKTSYNRI